MSELVTLDSIEQRVRALEFFRGGFLQAERVLDDALLPLLSFLKAGPRWVTFADALRQLGRSKKYLIGPVAEFGGRSRLAHWTTQGLAYQSGDGIWLISEVALARTTSAEARRIVTPDDPGLAAQELLDG